MVLTKLVALLGITSAAVATQVAVLMYGWGLEPKSWVWIIGAGVFLQVFIRSAGERILKEGD